MPITQATYERVALEDPEGQWELHRGRLREKPTMSIAHNHMLDLLAGEFHRQLDRNCYAVRTNSSRVRRTDESYYIPDLVVFPIERVANRWSNPENLEVYDEPMPLVVEVWSPSTGDYDVDAKLPEYRRRGDFEIWRLHPFNRTLIAWCRQPNGGYAETIHTGGTIQPVAIPDVTIDLDSIFLPTFAT